MSRRRAFLAALLASSLCERVAAQSQTSVVVIGNSNVAGLDPPTLQRVYTGRVIELAGVSLRPVNLTSGSPLRARFLQTYLKQDEEQYVAYWTVRRYVGKGTPPRELNTTADVVRYVQSTPGAIGYVNPADAPPGVIVLLR